MIVDVRTYTLQPRALPKYVALFAEHAMPVQTRHGLQLLGYYVSEIGPQNQVVHLWVYDSLADLETKRAARNADPDWQAYLAMTEGLVLLQENKIMRPSAFSPTLTPWGGQENRP